MNDAKTRIVVFTKSNARILINNERLIKKDFLFLINPRMDVDNMWPQYWKPGPANTVIVMNSDERKEREKLIAKIGIDNDIFEPEPPRIFTKKELRALKIQAIKTVVRQRIDAVTEPQWHFYLLFSLALINIVLILLLGRKVT
jgi:hypothetical protein